VISSPRFGLEVPLPKDAALVEILNRPISSLNFSVRAGNCLDAARITTINDLVLKSEGDLLRFRSFGKTSLHEVQRKLADIGLTLGMKKLDDGTVTFPEDRHSMDPGNQWRGSDDGDSSASSDSTAYSESGPMEVFTMGE